MVTLSSVRHCIDLKPYCRLLDQIISRPCLGRMVSPTQSLLNELIEAPRLGHGAAAALIPDVGFSHVDRHPCWVFVQLEALAEVDAAHEEQLARTR